MSETPVKWTAAGLTPEGNALQAALLGTGDGLTFTRAAAADAEGVERLDLTLQAPCTVDGPKCRVPVLLTNAGVETGFTMTELRFYVRRVTDGAPTGEEVLYATVTDETGDPIPTAAQSPGFTIDWAFVFQFGNASEVTVTLDPVGLVSIGMVGQPNGVAGLGENGAVSIPQGGTGATTVQGVVDVFGIFLAISAAAAYDPEGSYAVGDYCTHGGKLHKCSTPIESGEAWNAAHWTETTVAAELKAVKTELKNKLVAYTSLESLGLTESNATIESIITAMADNTMLAVACGTDGYDAGWIPASYGLLRIQKYNIYHAMVEYQRDIPSAPLWRGYYNTAADTPWSGWVPISTATPSQEHAIVPKNGATIIDGYKNSYSKDQFGHVLVYFSLRFASVPNNNTEIFSLPQSFLPTGGFVVGAACLTMNISFPAMVTAKSDGSVLVSHNVTGYSGAINLHGFLVIDTQQGGAAQ